MSSKSLNRGKSRKSVSKNTARSAQQKEHHRKRKSTLPNPPVLPRASLIFDSLMLMAHVKNFRIAKRLKNIQLSGDSYFDQKSQQDLKYSIIPITGGVKQEESSPLLYVRHKITRMSHFNCLIYEHGFDGAFVDMRNEVIFQFKKKSYINKIFIYFPPTKLMAVVRVRANGCSSRVIYTVKNDDQETILICVTRDRVHFTLQDPAERVIGSFFKNYMMGEVYDMDFKDQKLANEIKMISIAICIYNDYIYEY